MATVEAFIVTHRPHDAVAVKYTGDNGRNIIEWIKSQRDMEDLSVRNGGGWMKFTYAGEHLITIRKGDYVLFHGRKIGPEPLKEVFPAFLTFESQESLDWAYKVKPKPKPKAKK